MFDSIASDWARKRKQAWGPLVNDLDFWIPMWKANTQKENIKNQIWIDLGAGAGRHTTYLSKYCRKLLELDISREMLKQDIDSKTDRPLKIQATQTHLPFRKNCVQAIFSIAAFHHIETLKLRTKALEEMKRIALPKALLCITVWRFYQPKFIPLLKKQLSQYSCENNEEFEIGDVSIPWTVSQGKDTTTIDRYYHLFLIGEFRRIFTAFHQLYCGTMGKSHQKKPEIQQHNPKEPTYKNQEKFQDTTQGKAREKIRVQGKKNFIFIGVVEK